MDINKLQKIKNIQDVITDVPSLPVVASRLLHIIADDASSLEELKKVISLDQSFSARLLRIANSPYYRGIKSVDNVTDAIIRIGFTTIKALVFAASLKDLFRMPGDTDKLLWEHNMAVSVGSTVIAKETALFSAGEPLIHGLLHDIGKVVINLAMRDKYAEVINTVKEQNIPFAEAERTLLGFDHCDFGEYVAHQWNLPSNLSFVIANHHRDDLLETVTDTELKKTVLLVKAADFLGSALGIGISHGQNPSEDEWKFLKLSSLKKRDVLTKKIEEEYPHYRDFVMGYTPS